MPPVRLAILIIRDIWRDFSRHRSQFFIAILSLATGLFVAGGGLLAIDTLDRWVGNMEAMARITVFAAEGADINKLEQQLVGDPRFISVRRVSSEEATRQFLESAKDAGLMLDTLGLEGVPANLELTLRPDLLEQNKAIEVGEGLRKIQGAGDVIVDHERIDTLLKGARAIRSLLAGFGFVLLVVAAFSTGTVVRMSIMARDEEIHIMRLVGATEFFILAPLLLEGAILGLAGATVAVGVLWLLWLPLSMGKFNVSPFIIEMAKLVFFSPKSLGLLAGSGLLTGAFGALWGFRNSKRDRRGNTKVAESD
ncbi:MAG: hypothetical protein FWG12_07080 [Holophagaceae bacterium]|nr:hypothetical protein [Holophagaceae bacterium]